MQPASAQAPPPRGSATKSTVPCPQCARGNPAGAKFCEACGSPLQVAAEGSVDAPDLALAAELFKPLPRRHPRTIVHAVAAGAATVATLSGLAYYLYDNFFYTDFSSVYVRVKSAEESGADSAPSGHSAGAIGSEATPTGPAGPIEAGKAAGPAGITGSDAAPAEPARSIEAGKAARPAGATARTAATARKAGKPELSGAAPCTEAVAAVGLCTPGPGQARDVRAAASTGQAVEREKPRAAACTEATTALGLCTTATIEKKE